jgi:uncharacterized phage protein (TIGR02218 family)
MAFNDIENSNYDGKPVILYEFHRKSGTVDLYWRYSSADSDIVTGDETWLSRAISDGGVSQTGEAAAAQFQVTMPVTEDFPQAYIGSGSVPSDQVILTVRRFHSGDTESRVIWVGTVSSLTQTDEIACQINCDTLAASFRRSGLRLCYTRSCPHALYDKRCTIDPNALKVAATVGSITGNSIYSTTYDEGQDNYFSGGYLEWSLSNGATERKGIISHLSGVITIQGTFFSLAVGDTVAAYPGCDRTLTTCQNKFNNVLNFGGFPNTPGKSPFDGDPVF